MQLPPRVHGRWVILFAAMLAVAGCAGPSNRRAIFAELDPAPMTERAWARVAGTYGGPIHSSTQRNNFEGLSVHNVRLDLSGSSYAPEVLLQDDNDYASAWTPYGERRGTFTNIPVKRYGSQGSVAASTHAPNQLLLKVRRNGLSTQGIWLILTFEANGSASVDFVGRNGWRGEGDLVRVLPLATR